MKKLRVLKPSSVYHLYDEDGALLYVGMASDVKRRVAVHRRRQPWGRRVASVAVMFGPASYYAAMWEERRQICDLEPLHNIHYNAGRVPAEVSRFSQRGPITAERP